MRFSKLLLASAAIAAGGVGFYVSVCLFPAQSIAIVVPEKESQSATSTAISSVRLPVESSAPGAVAPNLSPEIGTARFSAPEKTGVGVAHELPSHNNRPSINESFQTSRESASAIVRSDRISAPPIEERPATLPDQLFATRALVASTTQPQQTKPQQPRAVEPSPSVKAEPAKTGVMQIPAKVPDANPLQPAMVPRKRAGAIATAIPVNLPSPENPPSSDNSSPRLPKFFNEEAELYRTQYGEEAYAARMHEAALSPAPSAPGR